MSQFLRITIAIALCLSSNFALALNVEIQETVDTVLNQTYTDIESIGIEGNLGIHSDVFNPSAYKYLATLKIENPEVLPQQHTRNFIGTVTVFGQINAETRLLTVSKIIPTELCETLDHLAETPNSFTAVATRRHLNTLKELNIFCEDE